ncbi:hypothetical protein [Pontimicrobium sp. MEBiC06410]
MKNIIIILCLCVCTGFAQNLEKIKNSEVLFIYYSGDEYESKKIMQTYKDKKEDIMYFYKFNETDNCSFTNNTIEIVFNQFYDFDEMFKNNPVPFFKINKSFLKKNKEIIINTKFMHEIGYNESYSLLYNAKTIFLIDKDDINNNIITVKKVRFSNVAEE